MEIPRYCFAVASVMPFPARIASTISRTVSGPAAARCAALLAGTPWLDVYCPGCSTSKAIDLRTVDRHPLAAVDQSRPRFALAPALLHTAGFLSNPATDAASHTILWASGLVILTASRRPAPQVTVWVDHAVLRAID
jgi:hypothetical protein